MTHEYLTVFARTDFGHYYTRPRPVEHVYLCLFAICL